MVRVLDAPLDRLPIAQFGVLQVPAEGVVLTKVYPDGSTSLITTSVALSGPLLVAVSVNVTLLPTVGVELLIVFTTERSVCDCTHCVKLSSLLILPV